METNESCKERLRSLFFFNKKVESNLRENDKVAVGFSVFKNGRVVVDILHNNRQTYRILKKILRKQLRSKN